MAEDTRDINNTWELAGNADSQSTPQTQYIKICILARPKVICRSVKGGEAMLWLYIRITRVCFCFQCCRLDSSPRNSYQICMGCILGVGIFQGPTYFFQYKYNCINGSFSYVSFRGQHTLKLLINNKKENC